MVSYRFGRKLVKLTGCYPIIEELATITRVLIGERSQEEIVSAVAKPRKNLPARPLRCLYAERFGWQSTTEGQIRHFNREIVGSGSMEPLGSWET